MTTASSPTELQEILDSLGIAENNPGAFCGRWLDTGGPVIDSINPATGEVIASVRSATGADYEQVAATADEAFREAGSAKG